MFVNMNQAQQQCHCMGLPCSNTAAERGWCSNEPTMKFNLINALYQYLPSLPCPSDHARHSAISSFTDQCNISPHAC